MIRLIALGLSLGAAFALCVPAFAQALATHSWFAYPLAVVVIGGLALLVPRPASDARDPHLAPSHNAASEARGHRDLRMTTNTVIAPIEAKGGELGE